MLFISYSSCWKQEGRTSALTLLEYKLSYKMSLFVKLAMSCMLEQVVFSSLCVYVGVSDQFAVPGGCETDSEVQQTLKEQENQTPCFTV